VPDDLDSFLQRAAQQRQKRKQAEIVILEPATSSTPTPAPPPAPRPPRTAPQPPQPRPARPAQPKPVIVIAEQVPARTEDISAHVATHLDSRQFEQRASHLGERVGLADDNLEAHLHQVFDHNVGSMGVPGQVVQSTEDAAAAAIQSDIMDAFRDADSMRRAIILNEILSPPGRRWRR